MIALIGDDCRHDRAERAGVTDAYWTALLEPVARRLLADRPCVEHNGDLRFGARGSLVVHLQGSWAGT